MKHEIKPDSGIEYDSHTWPGFYPLVYFGRSSWAIDVLCVGCASNQYRLALLEALYDDDSEAPFWSVIYCEPHMEGPPIYCEDCEAEIESVYGDRAVFGFQGWLRVLERTGRNWRTKMLGDRFRPRVLSLYQTAELIDGEYVAQHVSNGLVIARAIASTINCNTKNPTRVKRFDFQEDYPHLSGSKVLGGYDATGKWTN